MRHMSFMLTIKQVRNRTKTVTRRIGWWNVKRGEVILACEKCQGLKKGEKVQAIDVIRVRDTTLSILDEITAEDIEREGFPGMSKDEFVAMFCKTHKRATPRTIVNRIEFEYVYGKEEGC